MAYTQTDLDNLDRAIADGNLTVRFGDRTVTRRSVEELMILRQHVERQLNVAGAVTRAYPRFQTAIFSDG